MFAVVESVNQDAVFVASETWIFTDNGKTYSHYPPKTSYNPEQMAFRHKQPSKNWILYEINVLKQGLGELLLNYFKELF